MKITSIDELKLKIVNMDIEQLRKLAADLYDNYFDIRRTLDEQMIVNEKMYSNHYFYEAKVYEAKAMFLYVKSEIMMRNNEIY